MKVIEPLILAKLQEELRSPAAIEFITQALDRELDRVTSGGASRRTTLRKQLDQEKTKLANLIAAIEAGGSAPATMLNAIRQREATIKKLEKELAADPPRRKSREDLRPWVEQQLQDLVGLLKQNSTRTKAEFRRLNLHLTFTPHEAKPRAYYTVKGQCDLRALALSFVRTYLRDRRAVQRMMAGAIAGALVDSLLDRTAL
jgi:hypothetical protein